MHRKIICALFVSVLAGCATAPPSYDVPVVDGADETITVPEQQEEAEIDVPENAPWRVRRTNSAVIALLETARDQQQQQKYVEAAASLERAIRIAPRDPQLYLQLAKVRLQQGRKSQAQQLCNKAVALSGNDTQIQDSCYILLSG